MTPGLYDWTGGREAMLRFGPDTGPVVVAALPLFEEANRTRAFMVSILRALAERGIASILPDLPGQGESLDGLSMPSLQAAFEAVTDVVGRENRRPYGIAIRSGALLDPRALLLGRWHFAPQDGADLVRELTRIKQAELGTAEHLSALWYLSGDVLPDGSHPPVSVAGNLLSADLLIDLKLCTPVDAPGIPRRVVRLATDPKAADIKFPGAPLWRRSEPDNDLDLVQTLAADIAGWVATCEA